VDYREVELTASRDEPARVLYEACSPAGERWLVEPVRGPDGRAPSRRFLPSRERLLTDVLAAALHARGASEEEAAEAYAAALDEAKRAAVDHALRCAQPLRIVLGKEQG
jgi:hypothetical protein